MEGSIFKKKGFFIALYSSLGAVMVLALVISFTTLSPSTSGYETADGGELENEIAQASADQVESYLNQAEMDEQAWLRPRSTVQPLPTPMPTETPKPTPVQIETPPPPAPAPPESPPEVPPAEVPAQANENVKPTEAPRADAFTPFTAADKMIWPVTGEIAMVFSMDKLIYDPTLDQYRTNDDLRIVAKEGTPVKSGFGGQVVAVGKNNLYGNFVSIDHGNGYIATYGQLMDGVLVKEGETVKEGQVIGGVGKPSIYGSLNGTHLNLRVTKDSAAINPQDILLAASDTGD
jgi:murein DD-endopeptidase MepM/ murein hydrolase activator NlpD